MQVGVTPPEQLEQVTVLQLFSPHPAEHTTASTKEGATKMSMTGKVNLNKRCLKVIELL
jgi:hypothetical protein